MIISFKEKGAYGVKISTKGRYALRLMIDLAENGDKGYVTIKNISERQEISNKYLEQIISVLTHAGFVKSARGAQGGYKLAKPAGQYTVGSILRLIEGSLVPVACMEDKPNKCPRSCSCETLPLWEKLNGAISGIVDNITLADLLNGKK